MSPSAGRPNPVARAAAADGCLLEFFLRQVEEAERYSVDEFESVLLKDIPENGKVPCERVCDATARMTLNFAVSLKHNLACILMLAGISGWDSVVF